MAVDPSVVSALERAVAGDPENHALRLHLASLQLVGGDAASALVQAQIALAAMPDSLEALVIARDAARASGDEARAAAFARLLGVVGPPASPHLGQPGEPQRVEAEVADENEVGDVIGRPAITLADVGGMEDVKRRLELAFLGPMRNPEMSAAFGKSPRGGLLLYGPPGCGKTFIARALAGELGASFLAVGLNDVLDMWLGESEKRLHELFAVARRAAPCVLFFDEVDALGRKRSQLRHSAGRNVINQLLSELDGIQADNDGLFVLAATNHPWDVDTALRRPGRLSRTVLVLPPDRRARIAILTQAFNERPVAGVEIASIADRTDGFSGADLVALGEAAAELALADSLASGEIRPISQTDVDAALGEARPSTRPWFSVAYNYAMYANEGGEYDDLLAYIRKMKLQ